MPEGVCREADTLQQLQGYGTSTEQRKAFIVPERREQSEVADNILANDGLAAAAAHEGRKARDLCRQFGFRVRWA